MILQEKYRELSLILIEINRWNSQSGCAASSIRESEAIFSKMNKNEYTENAIDALISIKSDELKKTKCYEEFKNSDRYRIF